MRFSIPSLAAAVAVGSLLAVAPVTPAGAGNAHSITASPTTVKPGETVTVTGTSDCNSSPFTVTLTYTNPEGDNATATASGTTDASGEYSQPIVVPDAAVAGEPATVTSNITSCNGGGAVASQNTVALTIDAHEGVLSVSPTSGPSGTQVTINGTNCYGGDVFVGFTDGDEVEIEVQNVTLDEETRAFTATFTIPGNVDPGQYAFVAECPGTDFNAAPFTVTGEDDDETPVTPEAPPATPVGGTVTFTG